MSEKDVPGEKLAEFPAAEIIEEVQGLEISLPGLGKGVVADASRSDDNDKECFIWIKFPNSPIAKKRSFRDVCSINGATVGVKSGSRLDLFLRTGRTQEVPPHLNNPLAIDWRERQVLEVSATIAELTQILAAFLPNANLERSLNRLGSETADLLKSEYAGLIKKRLLKLPENSSILALLLNVNQSLKPPIVWNSPGDDGARAGCVSVLRDHGLQILSIPIALYIVPDSGLIPNRYTRACLTSLSAALVDINALEKAHFYIRRVVTSHREHEQHSQLVLYRLLRLRPDLQSYTGELSETEDRVLAKGWLKPNHDLNRLRKSPAFPVREDFLNIL